MEKVITVKGLKTFYREKGEGRNLLILHGWGSDSDTWQKTQDYLKNRGFRVVALDLPGFGRTQEPKEPWHLKEYSEFVHEFTQAIGLNYFTLAGHSFGGRIGIDYALRYHQQLEALVLISAAGAVRHKKLKIRIMAALTKGGELIFSIPILSFLKPLVRKFWYKFAAKERDYEKASPIMKGVMQRILEEELKSYLPSIRVRTLILWGEQDTATPLSDGLLMHKLIPNTHMHIFKNKHHALNLEAPIGVAKQIYSFMQK